MLSWRSASPHGRRCGWTCRARCAWAPPKKNLKHAFLRKRTPNTPSRRASAITRIFTSACDIQPWEYQPLGPFLSKNFGSTLSPWVVTMEALAPFRAPFARPASDPQPLPYLESPSNRATGALDIHLEAWLQTTAMRVAHAKPVRLSTGNVREAAYWTPSQLVTHHSVGGCNLRPGDLFGSGTLS